MDDDERTATALVAATRDRVPIAPLTDSSPDMTADRAYRIQQLVVEARLPTEGPVVGYKVGLTSKPMQELLGIDTPDYGPILSSMYRPGDTTLLLGDYIGPRVEAEIAFQLRTPLRGPGVTAEDVLAATAGVMAAIEVIDSRITDWRIRLADTIADMASSAVIVTSGRPAPVEGLALDEIRVAMHDDDEEVAGGVGGAVLGHPANAAAWLVNTLGEHGVGLEAGHVVMPGAMHAAVTAQAGHRYRAVFDHLGSVEVAFEEGSS
ncbi:MAG TPA: 2-keto-4-pentenoate hydratase [Actinomycetota bacterium]|jgi:2-keto-4-pentenoate hydratase